MRVKRQINMADPRTYPQVFVQPHMQPVQPVHDGITLVEHMCVYLEEYRRGWFLILYSCPFLNHITIERILINQLGQPPMLFPITRFCYQLLESTHLNTIQQGLQALRRLRGQWSNALDDGSNCLTIQQQYGPT